MKKIVAFVFVFLSQLIFSQGEANIWYFGQNAGLDFSSGSPVALTNGQLNTYEGCATLSDASGQLLMYTDGVTVYNRNHNVMINGSGLFGDADSSQSATIVKKPGSNSLYYIFTIDANTEVNGFCYSIVDMTLDGGLGAVTSDKNVLIYTPTCEKLGIVKHANNTDFWVVTHGWNNNNFYTYLLNSSGLSTTPVTSSIGYIVQSIVFSDPSGPSRGYLRISPNGSKIACCNANGGFTQLFDFNNNTGLLSNEKTISIPGENSFYGVEFSPNNEVLYLSSSTSRRIYQLDINAVNVGASATLLYSSFVYPGALQLAPDEKIYIAFYNQNTIGVINNPNTLGLGCDFQPQAIDLGGNLSKSGLPPFVTSFFYNPAIQLSDNCEGDITTFSLNNNQTVLSSIWNFGDGNTSNALNPSHIYANPGNYTVSVTVSTPQGTGTNTRNITIHPRPTLNSNVISLKQCDDNNDGFSAFNLKQIEQALVSNTSGLTFTYHLTQSDADNALITIPNPIAHTNQIVSNDVVYVRVENDMGCYSTARINLTVSTTQISNSIQEHFYVCDDLASGSNTDGIATFDFSSANAQIASQYPSGQLLDITYYRNITDALAEQNAIPDISNYTNIGYPNMQNIYVRVDSQLNNECIGLGHHITLHVERIPIIQPQTYNQCDDNQDGIFAFNTTTLQADVLNGLANVTLSYWDANNSPLPSPLPNPFNTTSQTIRVRATNNTTSACFYESTITFKVDDLPEAFAIPTSLTIVCDDEANPINQDGIYPFNTTSFQNTILGTQTGMIVNYFDGNGNSLSSPLPNPFLSATQNIRVEVINPLNTTCKAYLTIPLVVQPVPEIELFGYELVCSNNPLFTKVINAGLLDETTVSNFTYQWFLNNNPISGATNYSLTVNTEGIYTVSVSNSNGCVRTRTITVAASNIATINDVQVVDLSDENSVTILVTGSGDYEYSIDNENYQDSNYFPNVSPGIYTIYVRDKKGCGSITKEISILGIPDYFTPNGDGYNDYWNIKGINSRFNANTIIYIFDRFGKLVKQISPLGQGWDGTFNGNQMPSSDYWYSVQLEDGRVVKGHFSLKR
ncbi:T9SS type B sorting domain-containing protein [Flavobacterium sasangense]|uniref:T9SS type B sorting domain-containing protein n=1 Tax=Flavobacterium sasangense TaxID=503361 RepID=UPI00047B0452|nr:T9SS C-terminal target domain-containing protein [Flavobacterium sasangense]